MKQCTSKGCYADRKAEDRLFCPSCRIQWRNYCKKIGIETIPLPEKEVNATLKAFQMRLGK